MRPGSDAEDEELLREEEEDGETNASLFLLTLFIFFFFFEKYTEESPAPKPSLPSKCPNCGHAVPSEQTTLN